jgi:tetratricopeptide (TPR) repeat protein
MLPGSGPAHLAEVLLGGLVTTSGVPGERGEPRHWRYEFAPGVRDLLLSGLGRTDASRVLTTVSRDLNARLGRGADEFTGVVPLSGTPPAAAAGGPFAEVSAQVLERITGRFSTEHPPVARPPSGHRAAAEPSATLIRRYQRTGAIADIDAAIAALRDADSKLELAAALRARYLVLADPDDLDAAISLLRGAMRDAGTGPAVPEVAEQLASALGLRHARTSSPADIDDAVAAAELAAGLVTEQSKLFPRYAATLAALLVRRGSPDDLDAAVSWLRRAVAYGAAREDQARLLASLSAALRGRAGSRPGAGGTEAAADLDEAIYTMRRAVVLSADRKEQAYGGQARELAERHAGLGGALLDRGQLSGDSGGLREAAECYRAAVALAPPGQPETGAYLAGQGIAMRLLAADSGHRDDADQAVRLLRQAIAETAPPDPELPRRQAELATSLIARFESDGHRGDLLEARQLLSEAAAALTTTLGAGNPQTLAARVGLARVAVADGRIADARAILTEVLSSLPPDEPVYRAARALVESLR